MGMPVKKLSGFLLIGLLASSQLAFAQEVEEPDDSALDADAQPATSVPKAEPSGSWELRDALRRIAQRPNDASALFDAGNAALMLDDAESARGFFTKADALRPNDGRIKAGLGAALVRSENPFEALRLFDEAIRLGISDRSIAMDRGLAFDLLGNFGRAQQDYQLARSNGQSSDRLVIQNAISLGLDGKNVEADNMLVPLLQRENTDAWRARAFILAARGDFKESSRVASSFLDPASKQRLEPYLRQMPQLTGAQKAAAIHFGHFPPITDVGRDSDAVTKVAATLPQVPKGEGRLTPSGTPLGSKPTTTAKPRKETREERRAREQAEKLTAERAEAKRIADARRAMEQKKLDDARRIADAKKREDERKIAAVRTPPSPPANEAGRSIPALDNILAGTQKQPAATTVANGPASTASATTPSAGPSNSALPNANPAAANLPASTTPASAPSATAPISTGLPSSALPPGTSVANVPNISAPPAVAATANQPPNIAAPAASLPPKIPDDATFLPASQSATVAASEKKPVVTSSGNLPPLDSARPLEKVVLPPSTTPASAQNDVKVATSTLPPQLENAAANQTVRPGFESSVPPTASAVTLPPADIPPASPSVTANMPVGPAIANAPPEVLDPTASQASNTPTTPVIPTPASVEPAPVKAAAPAEFNLDSIVELIEIPESEQQQKVAAVDLKKIKPIGPKPVEAKATEKDECVAVSRGGRGRSTVCKSGESDKDKSGKESAKEVKKDDKKSASGNASRYWVQIATGGDLSGLYYDYRRMAKKYPDVFKGKSGFTAAWGRTNRLVVGPFVDQKSAKKFESDLRKAGGDGFVWQSEKGSEVNPVRAK